MTNIHRAVVRGHFDDLDDDTRAALLADADEHDFLKSAFTADGTRALGPPRRRGVQLRAELSWSDQLRTRKTDLLS